MNLILFGPPGAGKGTQADNLVKEFKHFKVSTGDLLRNEIKKKSLLGNEIKSKMDKGLMVSDDAINGLVESILSDKSYFNRLIFDGYPRNLNQVKNLDALIKKYKQKISCVLSLKVEQDTINKRILGRLVCSLCGLTFNKFFNPATTKNHKCDSKFIQKRSDDNEKTIKKRFETYVKETLPILEYYQNQNLLYEIDGKGEISIIYKEIQRIILSLET